MQHSGAKNVILLTIDSLRTDYTDKKRYEDLRSQGVDVVSFDSAFSTGPGTTPSFPAMLTGTMPLSYGGLGPLTDERPRVSKQLRDGGVNTAGFQCNPFLSSHFNYDVGFDTFEDYQNPLMGLATKVFPRGIEINNPKLARVDDVLRVTDIIKKSYQLIKGKPRPYVSAEVITDDTIEWLRTAESPFFCWAHYMDVHHPCFPPKQYRRKRDVEDVSQSDVSEWYSALLRDPERLSSEEIRDLTRLYEAAIEYVDDQVFRIVDVLEQEDLFENTCLVITSDHGELFGDYGQYGKPERMYDELLHVPLFVVNGPEGLAEATDQLVSLLDIPPIIHDVLDVDTPSTYEGRHPITEEPRETILAEHEVGGKVIVGSRSTDWLYEGDQIRDEHRLYDVRDGFEAVDATDPRGAIVREEAKRRLNELDVSDQFLPKDVGDEDVQSRLEDLGYI